MSPVAVNSFVLSLQVFARSVVGIWYGNGCGRENRLAMG